MPLSVRRIIAVGLSLLGIVVLVGSGLAEKAGAATAMLAGGIWD